MSARSTTVSPLLDRYRDVRQLTRTICEPLETEDYVVQSMPDASPTRWHLAHTTWFFETFLLKPHLDGYLPSSESFEFLFNSYYNSVGKPYPRDKRGLLTRPTVDQVWQYRDAVDGAVTQLFAEEVSPRSDIAKLLELGLHHEQQHQELMLTDLKHMLSCNPLHPRYKPRQPVLEVHPGLAVDAASASVGWAEYEGGKHLFGYDGEGFHFDNEVPRFEQLVQDFELQDRLVTNREYLEFVQGRGYERPEHWLSMGWAAVEASSWTAPLYWLDLNGDWHEFTLHGLKKLDLDAPVSHVSYFEADAFARWSGSRLPTEFEWERVASELSPCGNFAETQIFHPVCADTSVDLHPRQMFGDVWEWTSSQYSAYPGYRPPPGALGEYNGKFMCNQFVLRGGSCATSESHIRSSYRNFFPPQARWQFTGIRLAR